MDHREDARIVCIGGAVVDRKFHLGVDAALATSMCARAVHGFGGVARNVAHILTRRGLAPVLVSLIGDDDDGDALLRDCERRGIDARFVIRTGGAATAQYVAVLDASGELVLEIADMTIFEHFGPDELLQIEPVLAAAAWVFADANLPAGAIAALAAGGASYRLALDAVSVPRAALLPAEMHGIDVLFLNEPEARAYLGAREAGHADAGLDSDADARACARAVRAHGAGAVVMTRGARGALVAVDDDVYDVPAVPVRRVVDVTGAGDALIAHALAYVLARDDPRAAVSKADLCAAVDGGMHSAALTVGSFVTVHPGVSPAEAAP